ncbi:MAG: Tetrahydromethanopterin S-methyltransferase subunit A 1 [Methanosaeta sp. PtaB.Bin039]|nr:MAG: Tetrahydromethanopterin S-methyltransferase subunit A 1 [Methanosaeta sp. PtaB.Bin039]HOT07761.1 tetrahydromethanopterin S-methyltransferase subunit A [Methanotrichaceae archaeon]HQF16024.1 tetrahydromethanopterin S-methyltransferase subunit A [Methanotrichaceae archaeon]HQI90860.1 tetrahydromethanopterin S-methyltransferase subunit A [Methanotrichaceae archaeon]HQJ28184.1 tetrahydromethanopterin S-methyltransferase subunit A [Methanotrichaceae archaeon]
MALKKKPAEPWPVITGEYEVGNPESPVAVVTCGSHLKNSELLAAGAALAGPCKTENIGIEKMVANIVSNPNIRFLVITGMEVKGHITGQAIEAFTKDGIDKEGKIVGAKGAIPFIQNLTPESIDRFRQQISTVMMIDTEDMGAIGGKIRELASKDPGALDVDPMIIEIKEGGAEEEAHGPRPLASEVVEIRNRMRMMDMNVTNNGLLNKFQAGIYAGKIEGIALGMTIVLALFGVILRVIGGS